MADQSGPEIRLVVRTLEHGQFSYSFPTTATVADLKQRLEASTGIPVSRHRVLLRGRELSADDASLSSLNLPDNAVLHLATRPPPEQAQRSGGGGGAAAAATPGPQAPPGFAQGFPAPGGAFNPMDVMSMLQGLGIPVAGGGPAPGGIGVGPGGVGVGITIGPGGITAAGPFGGNMGLTPDQEAALQSSIEQMFGGAASGVPITFTVGGGGHHGHHHHHHHHHGQRNAIPPRLDAQGRYRGRSFLQGVDEMLVRLQNGNMQEDPSSALAFTPADALRRPGEAPAWAAAAAAFLAACRPVLRGAALSRETLAAVNRVFEAAGLAALPLGVRSFPIESLEHSADEREAGTAAGGGYDSSGDEGPPSLMTEDIESEMYDSEEDSDFDPYGEESEDEEESESWDEEESEEDEEEDEEEWETDSGEGQEVEVDSEDCLPGLAEEEDMPELVSEPSDGGGGGGVSRRQRASTGAQPRFFNPRRARAAAAAAAGGESDSDALPELCSDSSGDEEAFQPPRTRRRTSGPPPLIEDDDDLPPLLSDSEEEGMAARAGRARPTAAAAAAPAASWLRSVSDDDLILVAAVTVGELTRRYMALLGQEAAPVGVNALAVRLASRLRSLSSLDGASRREIVRQTRLVSGHLQRVAAAGAELGRAMRYLTGALGDTPNMQFLATQPGYIGWQGGRPVAAMHGGAAAVVGGATGGWGAAPPPGATAAVRMEVRRVPPPAAPPAAAAAAPPPPPAQPQAAPQAQQQAQAPPAAAQVASVVRTIAEQPGVPPGVANLLSALSNSLGAAGPDASSNFVSELSSGISALNRLMVTSVDINGITRDVQNAVSASLAGGNGGNASAAASAAATAVEGALRRHIRGLGQDAEVQERLGELGTVLGVDLLSTLHSLGGNDEAPAAAGDAGGGAPAPTPAPAPAPAPQAPPAPPAPTPAPAAAPAAPAPAAAPTPAPAPAPAAAPRPGPAGLGRGLQPRSGGGGGGPALPPRPGASGPSLPPRRPAAQPAAAAQSGSTSSRAPTASTAAPSAAAPAGGAGGAGGSGAGLSSLLSSVMSNPAMQQAAGQLLSGPPASGSRSGGAAAAPGGGLDLGALMNAAGPMLGQLMGGGAPGGPPSRTPSGRARPAAQPQPADLESALAAAGLSAEEAARWKSIIEADEASQASMGPQTSFSEAYLAAMPPRAASGLLAGLLGDD